MNRQEKELVVESLRERFFQNPTSFIVGYKGLTVNQLQTLRTKLRKTGASLKVAKARLMKLAVGDLEDSKTLTPYLKDQIGIVFVADNSSGTAKVLSDFAKDNEALRLVGGTVEGQFVDQPAIIRIASLPSKEVLLAQLCGTLNSPLIRLIIVLNLQIAQLPSVIEQIGEMKK